MTCCSYSKLFKLFVTSSNCCSGVLPSALIDLTFPFICLEIPATLTIWNSSKLLPEIDKNLNLSRIGYSLFFASFRTLSLNDNQDNSLLMNLLLLFMPIIVVFSENTLFLILIKLDYTLNR